MTSSNNSQTLNIQSSATDANENIKHVIKQATAPLHQKVEEHLSKILFNKALKTDSYLSVLLAMSRSYNAMENSLNYFPLTKNLLINRSKLLWLRNDIEYLQTICNQIDLPENDTAVLTIKSDAHAMGMLYVMEGATLGGGFIQRKLLAHHWLSNEKGIQFFSNYGKERMLQWQGFLELLQYFYQQNPNTKAAIKDGAVIAFNYIYQSIEEIKP